MESGLIHPERLKLTECQSHSAITEEKMKDLFVRIAIIAVLASVFQFFYPWWTCAIVAFVVEATLGRGRIGFFSGFYGVAIPWMILAAYIDRQNGSELTYRVLELFKLPRFAMVLIIVTGLLGGAIGGMASLAGSWVKSYMKNDR
jgi:hypothetical protein